MTQDRIKDKEKPISKPKKTSAMTQQALKSEPMLQELRGQVERVTYTNPENGYTVARVQVYGNPDLVTVVGNFMEPMPGEVLKMRGAWRNHPRYGEQFHVQYYDTAVPATVYGIKKYLGSGLIKGLGPKIAERIVERFGEETLDVIDEKIEDLAEVEGIGKKRIAMIQRAWDAQKEIREVMLFLQSHGVSAGYATKIFKTYGNDAIPVVKENPYRLATDIFGIGFVTADRIAQKLGFQKDSPVRAEAGILYVLGQMADQGHVYYPYEPLLEKCQQILEVGRDLLVQAIGEIAVARRIVIEDLNPDLAEFLPNHKAVYLSQFHACETGIAHRLRILIEVPKSADNVDIEPALAGVQRHLGFTLAEKQAQAVAYALQHKVMVITGGPGTGKTTIINAILKILAGVRAKVLLAAPTGRAAKRMSETTGHEAKTIHRLLEFSGARGGFGRNYENPLSGDVLVVDEASMIDTVLMHHLLKAVPATATLILVGDVNQLPAVGAGNVLQDIIGSGAVPVVELNQIFRQAQKSRIIVNAHRINQGKMPQFGEFSHGNDFYFIRKQEPEAVLEIILRLVKERIPARFGLDPIDDIQVLSPMNKGTVGTANLNTELQQALNPGQGGLNRGQRTFRIDDKVMQIRNNYEKEVFNGDIGRIVAISAQDREVLVRFEGRDIGYEYSELDELVLAYAVSVHKSQGSEYPAVVVPVLIQHYMLLQRNLIYTAVTRGRKLVILVGTRKALAIALGNDKTRKRYSHLRYRLGS